MSETNATPPTIVQLLFLVNGLIFGAIILILRCLFVKLYVDLNVILIFTYILLVTSVGTVVIYDYQNFSFFYRSFQQKKFKNSTKLRLSYIGNFVFFITTLATIIVFFNQTLKSFALSGEGLRELILLYLSPYLLHFTGVYLVCSIIEECRSKSLDGGV